MVFSTLQSTWWAIRDPRLFLLSAATTIGFGFAMGAAAGSAASSSALSSTAISAIVILFIARSWCSLAIAATTLKLLRQDRQAPFVAGVPLAVAVSVLIVTVPPLAPIVVGVFLTLTGQPVFSVVGAILVALGTFWVAAWSQAGMLLIDGRADLMEAGQASVFMTRGFRGEIIGISMIVGAGVVAATWIDSRVGAFMDAYSLGPPIAALVHLVVRVGADAIGTCCVAAMYYELDKTS